MDSTQNPAPAAPAVPESTDHTSEHDSQAAARTFDRFIAMLEDGDFNADLSEELKRISEELQSFQENFGGKPKAQLAITVKFTLDGAVFDIVSDFKTTLPHAKRAKSVAWAAPDGTFSPENPRQMNLFRRGPARVV